MDVVDASRPAPNPGPRGRGWSAAAARRGTRPAQRAGGSPAQSRRDRRAGGGDPDRRAGRGLEPAGLDGPGDALPRRGRGDRGSDRGGGGIRRGSAGLPQLECLGAGAAELAHHAARGRGRLAARERAGGLGAAGRGGSGPAGVACRIQSRDLDGTVRAGAGRELRRDRGGAERGLRVRQCGGGIHVVRAVATRVPQRSDAV